MRIAPLGIVILCLALGLTGCSSFGKKKSDATGPGSIRKRARKMGSRRVGT